MKDWPFPRMMDGKGTLCTSWRSGTAEPRARAVGLVSKQPLQSSESARTHEDILPSARRRPEELAKALSAADERG